MIKEIPASKVYVCDICRVTEEASYQQNKWYVLIIARTDSVTYASGMNKHLCPMCHNDVINTIGKLESRYALERDMGEIKDTLINQNVVDRAQTGNMQNNPRSG